MKITEWFPPEINPVHAGWYKRRFLWDSTFTYFNYWNGIHWYYSLHHDAGDRVTKTHGPCADECTNMEWCGLAEEPR